MTFLIDFCCVIERTRRELYFDINIIDFLKASKGYKCSRVAHFLVAIRNAIIVHYVVVLIKRSVVYRFH